MTTYKVPCGTIHRLAQVLKFFDSNLDEEVKNLINTVRLENHKGKSFAVASNCKIAAIEYLGPTDKADGACHLKLTPELLEHMKTQSQFGMDATITTVPQIALATLDTVLGVNIPNCCYWFDETPLNDWREWGLDAPIASVGSMYLDMFYVETLLQASPSGKLMFPEFIDCHKPITIRDRYNENWVGLLIPSVPIGEVQQVPAVLPKWWKA